MRNPATFASSSPSDQTSSDPRSFFHDAWYVSQYGKDVTMGGTPWDHYTSRGERLGYLPHPLFVPIWYSKIHNVENSVLAHYARIGRDQALRTHPLYTPVDRSEDIHEISRRDPARSSHLLDLAKIKQIENGSRFLSYLLSEVNEYRFPNPWFDRAWYSIRWHTELPIYGEPLAHYLARGGHLGAATGVAWDWSVYLNRYPDVIMTSLTPLEHFILHGESEGRRASRSSLFSSMLSFLELGDHEQVRLHLRSSLGWRSSSPVFVQVEAEFPDISEMPNAEVCQVGSSFLIKKSNDRSYLVGKMSAMHVPNEYLILGSWVIHQCEASSTEHYLGIPFPSVTDRPNFEFAAWAIAASLQTQVPLVPSRESFSLAHSLKRMQAGLLRVVEPSPGRFRLPRHLPSNKMGEQLLRRNVAELVLNANNQSAPLSPSFIRFLQDQLREDYTKC